MVNDLPEARCSTLNSSPRERLYALRLELPPACFGRVLPVLLFFPSAKGTALCFSTRGTTILIDSGPKNPKIDAGEKIVVPDLRALGVSGVDLILLSHPDIDHVGGTGAILKAYPNATVAISECFRGNHQLFELLSKWGRKPDAVRWLGPDYQGIIGEFKITIDCPQIPQDGETNDGSMVVRLADGNASAVFTGDAPAKVEEQLCQIGNWHSEIMKAGHHGSRTATCRDWIQAVSPQYAILSCGLNNEYHHPHKEVLDRLIANHIKICRTDQEGDITFALRNGRFERE